MINWIIANPFTILIILIISFALIYGFVRIMSFGIVKSFYEGRLSYYKKMHNNIKKGDGYGTKK